MGARADRRISAIAMMGTSIGLALASAQTADLWIDRLHGAAWLAVVTLTLGLALPPTLSRSVRMGSVTGFATCAVLAALVSRAGLVPQQTFGVVVVAGLLTAGAIHQIALTSRGHAVEGGLSAIAVVTLAVGLAYAWFGPLQGTLASIVEAGVGLLLWVAHLAWVDVRWRRLRRVGVPLLVASTVVFVLAYAWSPEHSLAPWEQSTAVVVGALFWWLLYVAARRLSRRTVWTTSERLPEISSAARRSLHTTSDLDSVASGVLEAFAGSPSGTGEQPEIITFEPPLRIRLASTGRIETRTAQVPEPMLRALDESPSPLALDVVTLRSRVVREPAVRELVDLMESRGIGAVVPCARADHLEGLLVLPLAERSEPLGPAEFDALGRLGRALATSLSSTLAERRAQSHINEVSALHRSAVARVIELQNEVEQLRGQCDVLGRGHAEDQSLHVAYSPSMRRVQTRAIELASGDEPVLVCGASGSPLLQVSRFIHDRGPRWEQPFIVFDCASTAPEVSMARLFGSADGQPGALDSAIDGTLLLRDLPALPRDVQARLSGALDGVAKTSSSMPRVMATVRTTRGEQDSVRGVDGELARLLGAHTLLVPSLRARREDIPSLVLLAVDRACRVLARDPVGIDQGAMASLVDHDWPGDVAELDLVVQLAVSQVSGRTIRVSDLPPLAWASAPLEEALDGSYHEVERRLLEQALRVAGGNKSQAARRLGLKRTTFLDKLRRHGLEKRLEGDVGGSAVG